MNAIIAIPAHNEAAEIRRCLSALAMQRDAMGAPIPAGAFSILLFANNCSDGTAEIARTFADYVPHPIHVIEERSPPGKLSAGWARKRAMDLAAAMLRETDADGLILTTDADSSVAPTWFAATLREMARGVDCVAGYIDANPLDIVSLGPTFLARGRLEDAYLCRIAEIYARCDARAHDPWPSHRVSSGASLAVTLKAYTAIGGLPPRPVGEDSALTDALERAGFKVRHSMDVVVSTSCRLDGRAQGGAADTMRLRHAEPDAPCDDDLEPALQATRRAIYRGQLRALWAMPKDNLVVPRWLAGGTATNLMDAGVGFAEAWRHVCRETPGLKQGTPLRPSDLPRQIAMADIIVRQLRRPVRPRTAARDDTHRPAERFAAAE